MRIEVKIVNLNYICPKNMFKFLQECKLLFTFLKNRFAFAFGNGLLIKFE